MRRRQWWGVALFGLCACSGGNVTLKLDDNSTAELQHESLVTVWVSADACDGALPPMRIYGEVQHVDSIPAELDVSFPDEPEAWFNDRRGTRYARSDLCFSYGVRVDVDGDGDMDEGEYEGTDPSAPGYRRDIEFVLEKVWFIQ